jgi:hypothetical protein
MYICIYIYIYSGVNSTSEAALLAHSTATTTTTLSYTISKYYIQYTYVYDVRSRRTMDHSNVNNSGGEKAGVSITNLKRKTKTSAA